MVAVSSQGYTKRPEQLGNISIVQVQKAQPNPLISFLVFLMLTTSFSGFKIATLA
jgi:hypothetical protein